MATTNLIDAVTARLTAYGYKDIEPALIEAKTNDAVTKVLNFCNINALPTALEHVVIDMACGECMYLSAVCGTDVATEPAVTSIKEGDTQVNFATEATPTQRKDLLINTLRAMPYDELIAFRRLRW